MVMSDANVKLLCEFNVGTNVNDSLPPFVAGDLVWNEDDYVTVGPSNQTVPDIHYTVESPSTKTNASGQPLDSLGAVVTNVSAATKGWWFYVTDNGGNRKQLHQSKLMDETAFKVFIKLKIDTW